jgi:hypothetical protein
MRRRLQYNKCPSEELARLDAEGSRQPWPDDNWIEVRRSSDDGATWTHAVRAGETAGAYNRNGNPPALTRLADDTLVLVFGFRGEKPSIKARVSRDGGRVTRVNAVVAVERKLALALWHVWTKAEAFVASKLFEVSRLVQELRRIGEAKAAQVRARLVALEVTLAGG